MKNKNWLNKGEWSELYVFLHLLKEPNLTIVDENLNVINNKTFKIIDILLFDKKYHIDSEEIQKKLIMIALYKNIRLNTYQKTQIHYLKKF